MNLIVIKIGQYYDPEYSEFIFRTYKSKREIYDENFCLTQTFLNWLEKNYNQIYKCYTEDRDYFEIDYFDGNDIVLY